MPIRSDRIKPVCLLSELTVLNQLLALSLIKSDYMTHLFLATGKIRSCLHILIDRITREVYLYTVRRYIWISNLQEWSE